MRKTSIVLAAGIVASLSTIASAQSNYFFDIRNTVGAINTPALPFSSTPGQGLAWTGGPSWPNDGLAGGGKGNGQILRICPPLSNGAHNTVAGSSFGNSWPNIDADNDCSTGDLFLYADVGADDAGTNGVISSIGLDIAIGAPSTRYVIASSAWTWTLTDATTPVNFGFAAGTPQGPGGQLGVSGIKYVKVPVSGASTYATAGGLIQNTFTQLGRLRVTAAPRNATGAATGCAQVTGANPHANQSTYNVSMNVNNLLITRTYSTVTTPASVDEIVSFGYTGGAPDVTTNGSTSGPAPGVRDAVIQVRLKVDFNGDGRATAADVPAMSAATGVAGASTSQSTRYLGDLNGVVGAPAAAPITAADIPAATALVNAMLGGGLCP